MYQKVITMTVCFLCFIGVFGELCGMTRAARIGPRLVHFSAHVTWWNFGEVECSQICFLDMVTGEDGSVRAAAEFPAMVSKRIPDFRYLTIIGLSSWVDFCKVIMQKILKQWAKNWSSKQCLQGRSFWDVVRWMRGGAVHQCAAGTAHDAGKTSRWRMSTDLNGHVNFMV